EVDPPDTYIPEVIIEDKPGPKAAPLSDALSIWIRKDLKKIDARAIMSELRYRFDKYPDTRGWVVITDTDINMPVVQGPDNNYYLDHSSEGNYYACGAIFADYRNFQEEAWDDFNTVLYGHNVWYGGMFHDVTRFFDESFFKSHIVYIFTADSVLVYKPFAIFEAHCTYKYFHPYLTEEDENWVSFARDMRDKSIFVQDVDFELDDHILTFSTCTDKDKDLRWSLQSKLIARIGFDRFVELIPGPSDLDPANKIKEYEK
ncbi:MAG: class B sortase, partial [Clostridia bacterium]|nr:class B sortase [Clostridia bacterium]